MSQVRSEQEPTMEEILSSIRKIIADEGGEKLPAAGTIPPATPAKATAAAATTAAPADDDVLELTDVADDEPEPDESQTKLDSTMVPARPVPPIPEATAQSKESSPMPSNARDEALVSPTTASASTNAFAKLTRATGADERPTSALAGRSVEDLLVELLRPALKDWLDQHLPSVVERVVEQEVKKLARRAELM